MLSHIAFRIKNVYYDNYEKRHTPNYKSFGFKYGAGIQNIMKKNIHPKYYNDSKIRCACGNSFIVGSTKESMNVELCSACHPFYTGTYKIVDTAGRVEKFKARVAAKKEVAKKEVRKKVKEK